MLARLLYRAILPKRIYRTKRIGLLPPPASKTDVQAVVDPFQEGYEEGFPDGKMDARKETEGFLYDDTNDFEGKAKREYEEGYEEGYGDGYDDELSRIEDGEEPEEE